MASRVCFTYQKRMMENLLGDEVLVFGGTRTFVALTLAGATEGVTGTDG